MYNKKKCYSVFPSPSLPTIWGMIKRLLQNKIYKNAIKMTCCYLTGPVEHFNRNKSMLNLYKKPTES